MNSGSATVSYELTTGAWLVTGVSDDGYGHQERFHGDDGKARATDYADHNFRYVTVVERV